jgi:hypothetical protein
MGPKLESDTKVNWLTAGRNITSSNSMVNRIGLSAVSIELHY